jgi:hypothetical protein
MNAPEPRQSEMYEWDHDRARTVRAYTAEQMAEGQRLAARQALTDYAATRNARAAEEFMGEDNPEYSAALYAARTARSYRDDFYPEARP